MFKESLKHITSIFMAAIVLFSSFSFTISSHYCGDILVDSSVFSEAENCGMEESHQDDCDSESEKETCNDDDLMHCKDVQKSIEGNSIEQQAFEQSEIQKVFFAVAFVSNYESFFVDRTANIISSNQYIPPSSDQDLTVLFENFRI